MIKSVRHAGIVVRDLKKSMEFYCSLGFVEHSKAIEESDFIDTVVGLQNTKVEWVKLSIFDDFLLELLQYHSHPEDKAIVKQKSNKLGHSHLAFSVENIDIFCEKIKEIGGCVVNTPALTKDKKVKVAYAHDNEGNLMEIVEVL